nr:DUF4179 domain-containing protein [Fredinandcohnia sp. SECRCQ15]
MDIVNQKVIETVNKRTKLKKRRIKRSVIVTSILALILFTGMATNTFTNIYYSWADWRQQEDELIRAYYTSGLGERLNLEQVSNGVKVTIKTAISDEFQTLIYYEIEDLNEENQYMFNYDGISVMTENGALNHAFNPTPLKTEEKNVFRGQFSTEPISTESETIELKLSKLLKANQNYWSVPEEQLEFAEGEWNFKIPVKKQPSTVYELGKNVEIDGVPVKFEKLIIAPTATILQYNIDNYQSNRDIYSLNIDSIETNEKIVKADIYGWNPFYYSGNPNGSQVGFETLIFEDPKTIKVHFGSMYAFVNEQKTYDIDVSKGFPQSFEYQGSEISIDKIEVGNPTKVFMTAEYSKKRSYERLDFQFNTDDREESISTEMVNMEFVIVDRNGKVYEQKEFEEMSLNEKDYITLMERHQYARYYETNMEMDIIKDLSDQEVIPTGLEIRGYQTTTHLEDIIEISLE